MASKDEEIAEVVAELDDLVRELRVNVEALNGILISGIPEGNDDGQEVPVP